ncbi:MAG: hypothetical protein IPG45_17710 [Deltaproteobacteria bacterium]|nr:hypothetical protein [Deltaproteobacteria bacterium]
MSRRAWCTLWLAACSSSAEPDAGIGPELGVADLGVVDRDAAGPDVAGDLGIDGGVTEAKVALAQAECGFLARCREADLARQHGGELSVCLEEATERWRLQLEVRSDPAASAQRQACQDNLQRAACWQDPWALGSACWAIAGGGRGLGAACAHTRDCADGYCVSDQPGLACGVCRSFATLDENCLGAPEHACGPHGRCDQGRCSTLPAISQGCAGRCQDYLDCPFDSEANICLPPIGLGDACELVPLVGGPYCPPERLLACVEQKCVRAAWVGTGELCDRRRWCEEPGDRCGPSGTCEVRPVVPRGAPCEDARCGALDYCAPSGVCAALRAESATCGATLECASGLACLGRPARCLADPGLSCP